MVSSQQLGFAASSLISVVTNLPNRWLLVPHLVKKEERLHESLLSYDVPTGF
jgi:hypothetical protein